MFREDLNILSLNGTEYPYKCDMVILEELQNEYGDIIEFEEKLKGMIRAGDSKAPKFTVPPIKLVCEFWCMMIREGIEIKGLQDQLTAPNEIDFKRQDEYTIFELANIAYDEYNKCFLSKTSGETTEETTNDSPATKKDRTRSKKEN